jgi:hypothetical protein
MILWMSRSFVSLRTHNSYLSCSSSCIPLFVGCLTPVGTSINSGLNFLNDQRTIRKNKMSSIDWQQAISCNTTDSVLWSD